jgi:riboflavin kinase/FMN adenylyltransferase
MRVFEGDIITGINKPVVTLGAFDGVHRGHSMLLSKLREKAAELGGESVVVTFLPHPRLFLGKFNGNISFLTSHEEKLMLLEKAGIDNTVVLRFDDELSSMEACTFVEKILAGRLGMKYLVVGFNHRFGRGGSGDFNEIADCAHRVGFGVERIGSLETDSGVVSSTAIREALGRGDLSLANNMLGYNYFLRGSIVEGRKLGRSIGFPTANISTTFAHKLLPADGVYVVSVQFNGTILHGMANIGHRPTVNTTGEPRSVEVHIFGFSETIYGQSVTLSFMHRLRDEMKFESVDALKEQLSADRRSAMEYLSQK